MLRTLGRVLRAADYKVTAVIVDDVLIDVEPGDTSARRFGIAFDLGTTTVVATLLDLSTGTPVAVASVLNAQQPFGADVITRISATMMDPAALARLTALAQQTLAELAAEVCAEGGVGPGRGVRGGAGRQRHHDPHRAWHRPRAARRGPVHPGHPAAPRGARRRPGHARAPAGPGGGVPAVRRLRGRRHHGRAARLRAWTGTPRTRLFVDIGTNCEIVLGNRDWLLATAAPAGPAFEGAAIRCGMRAADGAIEVVTMTPDGLELKVIGDAEPAGLCGSGLVDAVTGLVKLGLLDSVRPARARGTGR